MQISDPIQFLWKAAGLVGNSTVAAGLIGAAIETHAKAEPSTLSQKVTLNFCVRCYSPIQSVEQFSLRGKGKQLPKKRLRKAMRRKKPSKYEQGLIKHYRRKLGVTTVEVVCSVCSHVRKLQTHLTQPPCLENVSDTSKEKTVQCSNKVVPAWMNDLNSNANAVKKQSNTAKVQLTAKQRRKKVNKLRAMLSDDED